MIFSQLINKWYQTNNCNFKITSMLKWHAQSFMMGKVSYSVRGDFWAEPVIFRLSHKWASFFLVITSFIFLTSKSSSHSPPISFITSQYSSNWNFDQLESFNVMKLPFWNLKFRFDLQPWQELNLA
jgi:hypothetical protein